MPIPKPRSNESEDDFVSRCMGDETMKDEYPAQGQRLAVCFNTYKEHNKCAQSSTTKSTKK